ncbi:MAG: sugar-binding domain-containing protein [Solibacillus sp.]
MDNLALFEAQRQLVPELDPLMQKRFRILQAIQTYGPIGRRTLAEQVKLTERDIRNELTLLAEQQLIFVQTKGVSCTQQGYEVLEQLGKLFHELSGLAHKEKQLAELLQIEQVIIVPGDVAKDSFVLEQLGKEAAIRLATFAKPASKIAVTGGSSVAAITHYLAPSPNFHDVQFIAARGGMGDEMPKQANTLASKFAKRTESTYRTLFMPEYLSEQAYQAMKNEPIVEDMMALYEDVDIVIHGIGAAQEMATRRKSSLEERTLLEEKGAVGEAFGYYFGEDGQVVHQIRTIGIQLEQVKKCKKAIAIAAGEEKAPAIRAYFKNAAHNTVLITDERAAHELLSN